MTKAKKIAAVTKSDPATISFLRAAPTAGSRKYRRSAGSALPPPGAVAASRAQMSTLTVQNRKPGRNDRDFVEIPIRGTTRELA
jgi:hypothetical protein